MRFPLAVAITIHLNVYEPALLVLLCDGEYYRMCTRRVSDVDNINPSVKIECHSSACEEQHGIILPTLQKKRIELFFLSQPILYGTVPS